MPNFLVHCLTFGKLRQFINGDESWTQLIRLLLVMKLGREAWKVVESVVGSLKRGYGKRLWGIAVFGSVALGEERKYSDIDLLVVISRGPKIEKRALYGRTLVSMHQLTRREAEAEVSEPDAALPEILSGWRNMKILFGPGV